MATLITNASLASTATRIESPYARLVARQATPRRRRMSPEAGRAIEMLGHAIEYLGDEHALECMELKDRPIQGTDPRVLAIQLLMSRNREIYLNCPIQPTLGDKFRSLLGLAIV